MQRVLLGLGIQRVMLTLYIRLGGLAAEEAVRQQWACILSSPPVGLLGDEDLGRAASIPASAHPCGQSITLYT